MRDQLLYRHSPIRSILVAALFVVPLALVSVGMLSDGEAFGFLPAVMVLVLLVSTARHAASVRVSLLEGRLLWEHRSLLGSRSRTFDAGDVVDIRPETISFHRGLRAERLVFELSDGTVLEICPHYSRGIRMDALMETLHRLRCGTT